MNSAICGWELGAGLRVLCAEKKGSKALWRPVNTDRRWLIADG
jgi:hypothetical protein